MVFSPLLPVFALLKMTFLEKYFCFYDLYSNVRFLQLQQAVQEGEKETHKEPHAIALLGLGYVHAALGEWNHAETSYAESCGMSSGSPAIFAAQRQKKLKVSLCCLFAGRGRICPCSIASVRKRS